MSSIILILPFFYRMAHFRETLIPSTNHQPLVSSPQYAVPFSHHTPIVFDDDIMMNEGHKARLHIRCMEAMRHFFFTTDEDAAAERRTAFLPLQVLYDLLSH